MKRVLLLAIFVFCTILLSGFILAQDEKIEISMTDEIFEAGKDITFTVSLYDAENNLIDADVNIIIINPIQITKIEKTIPSNKLININLGENIIHGFWTISAQYKGAETTEFFDIEKNEEVEFELNNNVLIVKNTGNAEYSGSIKITIGESIEVRQVKLDVGKEMKFRLVAPDGIYNIKVTDGRTTLEQGSVELTGKVIGILEEETAQRSPLTGGIRPEGEKEENFYNYLRENRFAYVFMLVIFGAVILIAVEKFYKKKVSK